MDTFDNCRICLRKINHEPIKMTRLILRFLEESLQLANLAKPNMGDNVKQNLCAPCFNRISEFQDFLEQCKDSDEFWKNQFDILNKDRLQKLLTIEEAVLLRLSKDCNSLEADTTEPTKGVKTPTYTQSEAHSPEFEIVHSVKVNEEEDILLHTSQVTENETDAVEDFSGGIDLTNWPDDTNNDDTNNDDEVQLNVNEEFVDITTDVRNEIIEYEYRIEEDEGIRTDETASSSTSAVDYGSFAYAKIGAEETIEEYIESNQNAFFLTTSVDESGKVKMTYKCPQCDKTFNRIYDIESHCNIHNGVKPFTCNVCGKSFRQKNILTTHQALHFGKKVECAECGKKFARRSQLILHYRMHRDEKPFVCKIDGCEAAFRQRKQLVDHTFIHTGEKSFQCATCMKSFQTRKRLQDHIYKVHSQHRYCCQLCEKAFLKPHMLKQHMITSHDIEMDDVSHLKTLIDAVKPIKKTIIN